MGGSKGRHLICVHIMAFKLVDEKETVQKVQQVSNCRLRWDFFLTQ